jgi:hypothetical protein
MLRGVPPYLLSYLHRAEMRTADSCILLRQATTGQGIARRKVMGFMVSLTTMTDSLHRTTLDPK